MIKYIKVEDKIIKYQNDERKKTEMNRTNELFKVLNELSLLLPDLNRLIAEYCKTWSMTDFNNSSISAALKCILMQLNSLHGNPPEHIISAGPIEKDLTRWHATILGPPDTPYVGGIFKLKIQFPSDYCNHPPKIEFITPVYHCNINKKGEISLDILNANWCPALYIEKVLLSLVVLLQDPNPYDPLVPEIASLYLSNRVCPISVKFFLFRPYMIKMLVSGL